MSELKKDEAKDLAFEQQVLERFAALHSTDDLVELINFARTEWYGADARKLTISQFNYHSDQRKNPKRYYNFQIRKKSGGTRQIHAPAKGLKLIQKDLNRILQIIFQPHRAATGFVPGRSIVDNARLHAGKHYVYNLDLKDFFPSIPMRRVKACLMLPPFNLTGEREPIAYRLANLCCHPISSGEGETAGNAELPSVLPQGAPTSPTLTNIIAFKLDRRLNGLAKKHKATYSRYADDITFSSSANLFQPGGEFDVELQRIIADQNFTINPAKTRLQKEGHRQEVTGLVVNSKPNVHRRYIKQLRNWLYLWETYGYEKAQRLFMADYMGDKGHVKKHKPRIENVIGGKLDYLKMIKGQDDTQYKVLFNKLASLQDHHVQISNAKIDLDMILDKLVNKGLDAALELYDRFKNEAYGSG